VPCWGYVIEETEGESPRKVIILGDTCNSDTLLSAGQNADLVSHEATFADSMRSKAYRASHSTAKMAGDFARRINAKRLVLTHFSPRYHLSGQIDGPNSEDVKDLMAEAKKAFGKGAVIAAQDFTTWNIPVNSSITSAD